MEHKEEEAENLSLEDFIEIFESFESDPRKRSVLIGQSWTEIQRIPGTTSKKIPKGGCKESNSIHCKE